MNGLPYYKAYPRDFIEGTIGMTFEMKGAYRLVLDLIYMQGGKLPDDARYISGALGCTMRKWKTLRQALVDGGKLTVNGEFLTNERAVFELETLRKLQDKQRENASGPRKNKGLEKPRPRHTEPEPDITDTNVSVYAKPPKRKSRIGEDAEITNAMRRAAEKRNHSQQEAEAQFQKFKNDAIAKGKSFVDWDRAFITWLDSEYFRPITKPMKGKESGAEHARRIAELATRGMDFGKGQGDVVPLLPAGQPARCR